jgi:phosphatidate cytidylyltransferase
LDVPAINLKKFQMLKQRVITAIFLLLGFLAALFFLPALGWTLLVGVMLMQGTSEWTRLSSMSVGQGKLYWGITLLLVVALLGVSAFASKECKMLLQFVLYGVAVIFWVLAVPAWLISGWKPRNTWLLGMVGWAVLLPTGLAMLDLRSISPWLLLGAMALVWIADSAAYFAGRKFGKNKLAPSISPGKTWEGVAGGMAGVSLYVILLAAFVPQVESMFMLPWLLLAAWWWTGLAVIGDLFESAIKRQAGVKDSGALLPGHGGLLDRIDALTSTLPLAALALLFF